MIDKVHGAYCLICDICGEVCPDKFDDFYDAVDHKKESGWKSRKQGDGWLDVCPECQVESRPISQL